MNIDAAFSRFMELLDIIELGINSSETEQDCRQKVIDQFLVDVLQWRPDAIHAEHHTETGYADYVLSDGANRSLCETWRGAPRHDAATEVFALSGAEHAGLSIATARQRP